MKSQMHDFSPLGTIFSGQNIPKINFSGALASGDLSRNNVVIPTPSADSGQAQGEIFGLLLSLGVLAEPTLSLLKNSEWH